MLHLHLDDRTMDYVIRARQESLAETMAASHRRSWLVTQLGRMMVSLGEKLRNDCPTPEEIMAVHRRSRPRPSLT
jgi:hypothetical protein